MVATLGPQSSLPAPFLRMLVAWIMIIFVCFGLRTPANPLVMILITLSATTLSGMMFAIIDVVDPYKGLYNISSKNMHNALDEMLTDNAVKGHAHLSDAASDPVLTVTEAARPIKSEETNFASPQEELKDPQRDLSVNTIASYRDTWRMLIKYLTATLGVPADALDFDAVTTTHVTGFLDHLEQERGNSSQDPQRPTDRDPLRARPGPARPSRACRDHHPGPRDPTQTHNQASHRVPHPRRGRRTARRTRPADLDRTT